MNSSRSLRVVAVVVAVEVVVVRLREKIKKHPVKCSLHFFGVISTLARFLTPTPPYNQVGGELTYTLLRFMLRTDTQGSILCQKRVFSVPKP